MKKWLIKLDTQIAQGLFLEIIIVLQYEVEVLYDCFPFYHRKYFLKGSEYNKTVILTASSRASLNETDSPHPQQVCGNEQYNDY